MEADAALAGPGRPSAPSPRVRDWIVVSNRLGPGHLLPAPIAGLGRGPSPPGPPRPPDVEPARRQPMTVAKRIRLHRYNKGWGLSELADRARLSRTTLFQIES